MLKSHPKYGVLVNENGLTPSSRLLMRLDKRDRDYLDAYKKKIWIRTIPEKPEDRVYRTLSLIELRREWLRHDFPKDAPWRDIANVGLWTQTFFQTQLAVDLGLATQIPFSHPAHEDYLKNYPNGILKTAPRAEHLQEVA